LKVNMVKKKIFLLKSWTMTKTGPNGRQLKSLQKV
jgi:hypothetical protein